MQFFNNDTAMMLQLARFGSGKNPTEPRKCRDNLLDLCELGICKKT